MLEINNVVLYCIVLLTECLFYLQAALSLVDLLDKAKTFIPETQWESTPMALKATAGLRALPTEAADSILQEVGLKKGTFYIAQYPVRWTAQSALPFLPPPPWQTCSFRHQLGFSGKHSSHAAIMRND